MLPNAVNPLERVNAFFFSCQLGLEQTKLQSNRAC